jgi:hypothetical protein
MRFAGWNWNGLGSAAIPIWESGRGYFELGQGLTGFAGSGYSRAGSGEGVGIQYLCHLKTIRILPMQEAEERYV